MARILFLLPARDFDPSEAAVSWRVLSRAGHGIGFATPDGRPAVADDMPVPEHPVHAPGHEARALAVGAGEDATADRGSRGEEGVR